MAIPTQNWAPTEIIDYILDAGVLNQIPEEIEILIKNIIDEDPGVPSSYSEYRLFGEADDEPWLLPDSYTDKGFPVIPGNYITYANGMSFVFTPEFYNLLALTNGTYYNTFGFHIEGKNEVNEWVSLESHAFVIRLTVVNQITAVPVTFSPETLTFNHTQGNILPSLSVTIDGSLWQIIGKPNFILSSDTEGVTITNVNDSGVIHQIVSGSGEAIIDIALDVYYDGDASFTIEDLASEFVIKSDGVPVDTIPFTVVVTIPPQFFINPYAYNEKAFTLDKKFFRIVSENTGTYFQLNALIRVYDFFTNIYFDYTIPQKIVLFNGAENKINFGKIIHRLMRNFPEVNENLLQYKPAILSITCSEILIADESVVRTKTPSDIYFVAGLSRGITTLGFLDFNMKPNRVTKNSFTYLNILYPSGSYELRTFKNGTLIASENLPASTNKIICKKINFSAFSQGDVIEHVVDLTGETNENAPRKTHILFPQENYSNNIVWENEFLLQSALECTGTASIKSDFEFISQKIYQDLVEKLNYLASNKDVKLSINTGWLMKTDIDTVESLMRSKRVWLLQESGNISLRPIAKPMINDDLERELIEYTLEFTINRNYDEETYSL